MSASWIKQAACRHMPTSWFFPEVSNPVPAQARELCRACPVIDECLADALTQIASHDQGYRAGMTPQERNRIRPDRGGLRQPAQCGTAASYARHLRREEPTCMACREAHAARNLRNNKRRLETA